MELWCLLPQPSYTEAVMENLPSGVSLLKVLASDVDVGANGQISYSLHGPHAQRFRMDPRTGGSLAAAAATAVTAASLWFKLKC